MMNPRPFVRQFRWRRRPAPEQLLLGLALICTVGAKVFFLHREGQPHEWSIGLLSSLPDFVFFSTVWLVLCLAYLAIPYGIIARLGLLVSLAILLWSIANGSWLLNARVQLCPGVFAVLLGNFLEFWPAVWTHLRENIDVAVPILSGIGLAFLWVAWRVLCPRRRRVHGARLRRRARRAGVAWVVLIIGYVGLSTVASENFHRLVLSYNCHWHSLLDLAKSWRTAAPDVNSRHVPRAGERSLVLPQDPSPRPNVVVLLLESISHKATSLADQTEDVTPTLVALAQQGVEIGPMRVPVSQTSKAYWAAFTGTWPDAEPDFVEAALVDEPYESLATVLRRVGYRSGFFAMSKGSFKAAPATMANLGFDWAWYRENLGDESAYIGYLAGDDMRMIEPALEWAASENSPYLLTMLTSVTHDPYRVPESFEAAASSRFGRYQQTVRYTDLFVSRVVEALKARGMWENTLFCVLGDHGQSFRHHDRVGRLTPYEEVVRVPWIMVWPGHEWDKRFTAFPCSQVDVTPTLLRLLGFGIEDAGFDGIDALSPRKGDRPFYFSSWYADSPMGFTLGQKKYVYWPSVDKLFEYDLAVDPDEQRPRGIEPPAHAPLIVSILHWRRQARIDVPPNLQSTGVIYDHWQIETTGRHSTAVFVP